jgi:hypothetical protein
MTPDEYKALLRADFASFAVHCLLAVPSRPKPAETSATTAADEPRVLSRPCHCCGGRMIIIETFAAGCQPKHRPAPATAAIRIDTS